jgi:hypothetical protein
MADRAKQIFDSAKEAAQCVAPGLKNLVPDLKAEFARLGTQGQMELASALFNGDAFVPYGPGQYTPDHANEQQQELGHER